MVGPLTPLRFVLGALALAACASRPAEPRTPAPEPLMTAALAGAPVVVPPVTMVVVERAVVTAVGFPSERVALLAWADSMVGHLMMERAPEVRWILAPELRRVARRSPGVVHDPDQMGQAILRAPSLRSVPDPLRGYLRNLMAVAGGGRHAFIPAAIVFTPFGVAGQVRAEVAAVLADGRSGAILWRTAAHGVGPDPAAALAAAFATIFPVL